jgi:hypothetical protein
MKSSGMFRTQLSMAKGADPINVFSDNDRKHTPERCREGVNKLVAPAKPSAGRRKYPRR